MTDKPTHRLVKTPKVNARHLSDYMVASEIRRRTIIRDCKYRKIARVIQHEQAKAFISNFLRSGNFAPERLTAEGQRLLEAMSDSDFDRDTLDVNGDYLIAYGRAFSMESFPKTAEISDAPIGFKVNLNGVDVNPDTRFSVQRVTRTNRTRTGLGTIRYAKGKPLDEETASYQSSILYGCRKLMDGEDSQTAEEKLCLTLDCVTGIFHPAPGDATRRFHNVQAACATISERWDSIDPPEGAIIQ